ncbi:MAG: hypothetical protein KBT31_00930, partial [Firmicutes bacterium]|nr:hypothetical protein [Candidatus Colimorpha enterica]
MSILNSLKSALNKYSGELANTAAAKVKSAIASKTETITFDVLPTDLEAFKALPQADLKSPFSTAALTVLALSVWENDKETSKAMLNFLSGPEPISNYTCQMIDMSMRGKGYKPRSYFEGSRPDNNIHLQNLIRLRS